MARINIRKMNKEFGMRVMARISCGYFAGSDTKDPGIMLNRCDDQGVGFVRILPNSNTGTVIEPAESASDVFSGSGSISTISNLSNRPIDILDDGVKVFEVPALTTIPMATAPLAISNGLSVVAQSGIGAIVGALSLVYLLS